MFEDRRRININVGRIEEQTETSAVHAASLDTSLYVVYFDAVGECITGSFPGGFAPTCCLQHRSTLTPSPT